MRQSDRVMLAMAASSLLATGLAGEALAQDAGLALALTCNGDDTAYEQTGSTTVVTTRPGIPAPIWTPPQHQAAVAAQNATTSTTTRPTYAVVRVPARMSITVQGAVVRIRPPAESGPGWTQRRSADGWYALSEVAITETQIRGKAPWGGVLSGKMKLDVDRRTGDVSFGDFRGVCEKSSDNPAERKF